jgi:hypothetical protein
VAYESEQRHRGGFDRATGQVSRVEVRTLQFQGQPLTAKELNERGALIAKRRSAFRGSSSGSTNMSALLLERLMRAILDDPSRMHERISG